MTLSASPRSSYGGDHSQFAGLTPEQRERLSEVLDRYLSALENDAPLAKEAVYAEHPDLAETLAKYFESLERLHDMAAGFGGAVEADPENMPEVAGAKRIGDYELIREIGRGGMGVVYEARQVSLGRRVAVKLLPFAAVLDAKQIARFKHEAQAAAQLHHPNIVPVFAIGVDRGVHYYAMQYIDGQPLDRAIAELRAGQPRRRAASIAVSALLFGTELPRPAEAETRIEQPSPTVVSCLVSCSLDRGEYFRTVMHLGVQAAEALHAAHEYGVVHRDIKPSNLLLEADGKLWVTDFGLARFQRDVTLTRTGDIIGTMRYMSPEQAAGQSARVDHRTDIYSLGVTLYELVCLQPAFPEERVPALLKQIDTYVPPRPRQIRPEIPADLETVILKAMSHERDDRYATAQQLADDLRCVLEGKATAARPVSVLDRASRWARRHRRAVAASMALLVLLVGGLSVSTLLILSAERRASRDAIAADRRYREERHMLDDLGTQTAEELRDLPGTDQIRRTLLERTRQHYLTFIKEAQTDTRLKADAAVTYGKLGSLLDQLGSPGEALEAHQQAKKLLDELAAAEPGAAQTEKLLALAENNLGLSLAKLNRTDEARRNYEQAIRRQERLLLRGPQDLSVESELGASLCNLGLLEHQLRQEPQAQAAYQAAIEHLKHVSQSLPTAEQQRKLAAAYNNLAATHLASRPAEAARMHAQAIELLHTAAQSASGDMSLRHDLALTLNNLGSAMARAGQAAAGRASYDQAVALQESLVRDAPTRTTYKSDLAVTLNNLGMLENRLSNSAAAAETFQRSIGLYESVLEVLAGHTGVESNLGGVYNNLGVALERDGKLPESAAAFSRAMEHQQVAARQSPTDPRSEELLATHRENQRRALKKLAAANSEDNATDGHTVASLGDKTSQPIEK